MITDMKQDIYEPSAEIRQNAIVKHPSNPPVIIIQSDEGARNIQRRDQNNIVLGGVMENYNIDNAYYILNAMYLPGYDTTQLPTNLPPIDTFVVVLNHYLDAGITVDD